MRPLLAAVMCLSLFVTNAPAVAQGQADLGASLDTSLFSESSSVSNGKGPHLYAGRTRQGNLRRALLAFDVSAIPAGAAVTSASLTLNVSLAVGDAQNVSLHRVTTAWGEGASNAGSPGGSGATATMGDATWSHAEYDGTPWATEGGDFAASASAVASVNSTGTYTWTSEGLRADVQAWVDGAAPNFGWIIRANETVNQTAKRFDSRENGASSLRPKLSVSWSSGTAVAETPNAVLPVLSPNWPNPFARSTVISFTVDRPAPVRLEVYDLLGRRVETLVHESLAPGRYERTFDALSEPAGIYLARLQVGEHVMTRQMARMR